MAKMFLLSILLLVLGIISLVYYIVIISYAGISSSFSFVWLLLGIVCISLYFIINYCRSNEIYLRKTIQAVMIAVISIGIIIFVLIEGTIIKHANQKAEKNRDYLIVLGAQIKGTRVTKSLKKRLDTALIYLNDNPKTIAITSGGQGTGEDLSEAEAMKRYLVSQGINENRVLKEDKSTNTQENIMFSKKLLKNNATVVIVTNGFHIFRAISIAKKQGIRKVQGLSAPSDPILIVNYYVREVIGVIKEKLVGNI